MALRARDGRGLGAAGLGLRLFLSELLGVLLCQEATLLLELPVHLGLLLLGRGAVAPALLHRSLLDVQPLLAAIAEIVRLYAHGSLLAFGIGLDLRASGSGALAGIFGALLEAMSQDRMEAHYLAPVRYVGSEALSAGTDGLGAVRLRKIARLSLGEFVA
ncbi:MAG: hypothetical protein WC971_06520 [Coriobacteriia bacterium]